MPDLTNVPNPYTWGVSSRPVNPYVSNNQGRGLTEKERRARREQRQAAGACGLGSFPGSSGYAGSGGGFGGGFGGTTMPSQFQNFFSVQLSTDFLELPQTLREKREIYRHFYRYDPLVGQAIDLHTELPLSKVRLAPPRPRTCPKGFKSPDDYGRYILSWFRRMCKRIKLFQRLVQLTHHYWLDGSAFCFAEDSDVEVPPEIGYNPRRVMRSYLTDDGVPTETDTVEWVERPDREAQELSYYQKHYQGLDRLVILPIDQVRVTGMSFSDKVRVELIPSSRDREIIEKAKLGDPASAEMASLIPEEVRAYIEAGQMIPLGTDPDEGSFVYHLSAHRDVNEDYGISILDRLLRTLYYREKLRQAQTQIASRAMTPKRLVSGEGLSEEDVELLREQVDLALVDPDYSIVTNYEVRWEEMGARDRLLDLSSEYEMTERQMLAGLGTTESLMSGEALFSGDRLKLEVINTRYLFLREVLQEFVEEYLFAPVARRKGFVEEDEWGDEVVLYPSLSFTRLPLRDSQDTYDALFNLYQKGSVSIDVILEMFNLDAAETQEKLQKDMFTVNDATFNECMRSIYSEVGRNIVERTDVMERISRYLHLQTKPADEGGGGRF